MESHLRNKKYQITIKKIHKIKNSTVTESRGKRQQKRKSKWKIGTQCRKKKWHTKFKREQAWNTIIHRLILLTDMVIPPVSKYGGAASWELVCDLNDPEWISTNNICRPAAGAPWVWTQQKVPLGTRKWPTGSPCDFSRSSSLRPWNQLAVKVSYVHLRAMSN